MVFFDIKDFFPHLEENKRVMGIDMGKKRLGLAITDRCVILSNPHTVYKRLNMKKDLNYIYDFFNQQDCCGIVIGMPFCDNDLYKPWCEEIERFSKKLSNKFSLNILMVDESFTTQDATEILSYSNFSRRKQQSKDDKVSASLILGSFIKLKNNLEKKN